MKNGIVLELDVCDLHVESGIYECRFRKNLYKNGTFVKFLGYHRGSVQPVMQRDDIELTEKTESEKDEIIAQQQKNIDNMLALVAEVQAEQEKALKDEQKMFVEQKALREQMLVEVI